MRQYGDLLIDVIVGELPDILSNEYDPDGQYRANFMSVHKNMVAELKRDGRREPNYALDWWRSVENSSVVDLRKRRLSLAPLFLDAARAFLSIQASSASAERLFGDAGYQEGTRRQGTGSPVTEMLLMVRSYVVAHLNSPSRQTGFISNRAQAVKELAEAIATELEEWND